MNRVKSWSAFGVVCIIAFLIIFALNTGRGHLGIMKRHRQQRYPNETSPDALDAFLRAYLQGAPLRGAFLGGADLFNADLAGADLRGADLGGAFLSEANLARADLSGANLVGADLSEANLCGADLHDASLKGVDVSGAHYDGRTVWPEDFDPHAAGAVRIAAAP